MKVDRVFFASLALASLVACVPEEEPAGPSEPIGEELLSFTTALGVPGCAEGHLYWLRDTVQYQCFTGDGVFSWENYGTLTVRGQADLEAALAAADPSDTTAVAGWMCDDPESASATVTLWVDLESVSYPPGCPFEGVETLDAIAMTLLGDIGDCVELDLLESVDDGCRAY